MAATFTYGAVLQEGIQVLEKAGLPNAHREAEWLLMECTGWNRATLLLQREAPLPPEIAAQFHTWIARRKTREPLQYILGYTEFYGLRLHVSPAVLIPRPETEQMVEAILAHSPPEKPLRMLDLGTGSGCIALALKAERPNADIIGVDVHPESLDIARQNAMALNLQVSFKQADMRTDDFPNQFAEAFDVVASNPPYVPVTEADTLAPEVAAHEPHVALFSGRDPLYFYRIILGHAPVLLRPQGWLAVETHADFGEPVHALFVQAGLTDVQLKTDWAGHPRIVLGRQP